VLYRSDGENFPMCPRGMRCTALLSMSWLQLRLDFDCPAIRRLLEVR